MNFSNVWKALLEQGPPKRFIRNFFITGNAWGMFHINSHVNRGNGKDKVMYGSISSALKACRSLEKKNLGATYSPYKCIYCDGYHIGRNRVKEVSQ
jgi:hypothetical protein